MSKRDYERGIYIKGAFGRRDYMYVYEVAPWAYDEILDYLKVSIEKSVALDILDDWTRQLGQVDLARYLGAALGLTNPIHTQTVVSGAVVDPRSIRALTSGDEVTTYPKAGQTWPISNANLDVLLSSRASQATLADVLTKLDVALSSRSTEATLASILTKLDVALSTRALESGGNLASVKTNTDPLVAAAAGGYVRQDSTGTIAKESGGNLASIKTNTDTMITALQIIDDQNLAKWGGTSLTGRDISGDLSKLDVALSTRARLQPWYQTNFTPVNNNYSGDSVAPHSVTDRWSYTCPAGRIAMVMLVFLEMMRQTAPTTAGQAALEMILSGTVRICDIRETTSTVGVVKYFGYGQGAILIAGQTILARTQDGSTGGGYMYTLSANVMEFNT